MGSGSSQPITTNGASTTTTITATTTTTVQIKQEVPSLTMVNHFFPDDDVKKSSRNDNIEYSASTEDSREENFNRGGFVNVTDPDQLKKLLIDAVYTGEMTDVLEIIERRKIPPTVTTSWELNYYGQDNKDNCKIVFENVSLLHIAAMENHADITKYLLTKGRLKPDITCSHPQRDVKPSPLHLAAYNGSVDAIQVLIDHRANVNLSDTTEDCKKELVCLLRPIHLATRSGSVEAVKKLSKAGADSEAQFRIWDVQNSVYETRTLLETLKDEKMTQAIKMTIEKNYIDAASCVVFGTGIPGEVPDGILVEFTILARDRLKRFKKKGGDKFQVLFQHFTTYNEPVNWPCTITDNRDGSYTCSYTPLGIGKYYMHVNLIDSLTVDKQVIPSLPVAKSPYKIAVVERDETKVVPVRFHLDGVISHMNLLNTITLDQLKQRIIHDFHLKNSPIEVLLRYKNGGHKVQLFSDELLSQSFSHWKDSKAPKYELFLDLKGIAQNQSSSL